MPQLHTFKTITFEIWCQIIYYPLKYTLNIHNAISLNIWIIILSRIWEIFPFSPSRKKSLKFYVCCSSWYFFFTEKKNHFIKYRLGIKIDLNLDQGLNDWFWILSCLNGGKTSCLPGRWVRMDGSWVNIGKKLPELKKTDCVTHTTLPLHFWVPLIAGSQLLFRSHMYFSGPLIFQISWHYTFCWPDFD